MKHILLASLMIGSTLGAFSAPSYAQIPPLLIDKIAAGDPGAVAESTPMPPQSLGLMESAQASPGSPPAPTVPYLY